MTGSAFLLYCCCTLTWLKAIWYSLCGVFCEFRINCIILNARNKASSSPGCRRSSPVFFFKGLLWKNCVNFSNVGSYFIQIPHESSELVPACDRVLWTLARTEIPVGGNIYLFIFLKQLTTLLLAFLYYYYLTIKPHLGVILISKTSCDHI